MSIEHDFQKISSFLYLKEVLQSLFSKSKDNSDLKLECFG